MRPGPGRVAVEATTRYRLMDAPGPVGAERTCRNGHVRTGRNKDGKCKECQRLHNKKWCKLNPEKRKEHTRAWRQRNPEKTREFARLGESKRRNLPEPTRPMPQTCEACGGPPNAYGRLRLDHCHATGAFRGWLCRGCNLGLGNFKDSVESLERAIGYLTRVENYGTLPETMAKAKGD